MKKSKATITLFAALAITLLAGCGGNKESQNNTGNTSRPTEVVEGDFYVTYKGQEIDPESAIEVTIGDKVCILVPTMLDNTTPEFTFESSDPTVVTVGEHTGLLTGLKAGTADISVRITSDAASKVTFHATVAEGSTATGAHTYASASYEEKANILASLEKYAVDNYLTGITMFSNGSNICYNSRYVPTPQSYVTGYGWGTMREGKLSGPIQNPISGNDANFYQVATTSLPTHANALNASGSDVSTVYGYIANSYYSTRLNQASNGYEWYANTALDDKPLPIDDQGNVITENADSITNTRWRIHVKTGSDFVYRTASNKTKNGVALSSFDGRAVELEDYLTPIKFLLTCYNGQYRGAEQTKGISGLAKQAAKYYGSTTKQKGSTYNYYDEEAWEACEMDKAVKVGTDDKGDYIEFNLLQPCTQFYAMYYLSSNLYSPLPADFLNLWGGQDLGKFPDGYTPVDTMLSTSAYYITEWSAKLITFTKNDRYFYKKDTFKDGNVRDAYNLPGFQYNEVEDSTIAKQLFLDGSVDSYSPNKDDLVNEFKGTEGDGTTAGVTWRKYETKGDSNFKLNVNATTYDEWLERFGPAGTVYQHSQAVVNAKPAYLKSRSYMSDIHFLNFLSFGMDRKTICESRGMKPTQEYFSDNYLIDPESGVSYNSTAAHKAVLADRYNESYGYNADAAATELRLAIDGSIADAIKAGNMPKDSKGKYVINIDMEWMNTTDVKDYSDVFDSIKTIFNQVNHDRYYDGYVLKINEPTPSSDYNEVYNKMKRGEFDLGFGAVSGGDLDPINFMEVLKSDNSSGFTLNWGPDTSKINDDDQGDVVYDGKKWSYDALWNAANTGVLLKDDGNIANAENVSTEQTLSGGRGKYRYESKNDTDMSVTYKISFNMLVQAGAKNIMVEITNSEAIITAEIAELGATAENGYVATVTLDKSFNSYMEYDALTKDFVETESTIASVTVSYDVTIESVTKTFSSYLTLMTYVGIVPSSK